MVDNSAEPEEEVVDEQVGFSVVGSIVGSHPARCIRCIDRRGCLDLFQEVLADSDKVSSDKEESESTSSEGGSTTSSTDASTGDVREDTSSGSHSGSPSGEDAGGQVCA
jgi:hypothetical protein